MVRWNGADDRAVVPTPTMLLAREVLASSPHLVLSSPGSLCVGLYARGRPLPLRYVAPAVARPGVLAGWYAAVRGRTRLSVAVTPAPQAGSVVRSLRADDVVADVVVGGERANPRGRIVRLAPADDYVAGGFVMERRISSGGVIRRRETPFGFEGGMMEVKVAVRGGRRGAFGKSKREKVKFKRGDVGKGGMRKVVRRCRRETFELKGLWDLPSQTVTVQVCTPDWLRENGILEREFEMEERANEGTAPNGEKRYVPGNDQMHAVVDADVLTDGEDSSLEMAGRVNASQKR